MNGHMSESQLHDYLDGLLPPDMVEAMDAHLAGCDACQAELAALAELLDDLASLPDEARPERDLWGGIEARISEAPGEVEEPEVAVIPLTPRLAARRRISLTVGQLLAAGIVLASISAGTVWMALGSGAVPDAMPAMAGGQPEGLMQVDQAYQDYDEAVEELEEILRQGRQVLDPRTVLVLEESLAEIDAAIEDAREALAADPASPELAWALTNNMKKKLGVLRQAAGIIQSST
jgi:tetratricopeptide (TPR) repeat protein